MGGICGCIGLDRSFKHQFSAMVDAMAFRGMAKSSYFADRAFLAVLAHNYETELKVVKHRDIGIVVAAEGEIYNAKELHASLKNPPAGGEDQHFMELILCLYKEKGRDFAREINGVFIIAVWDIISRRLTLVRDHLGSHSVFYYRKGPIFAFSSTINSLFSLNISEPELDADSLDCYLAALAISPPDTMFKGVYAVRPGHLITFSDTGMEEYAYWPIHNFSEDFEISMDSYAEQVRDLFVNAVAIRACRPGKQGALVSGGVDTSAIVSALFDRTDISSLDGFSISFAEKDFSDAALQQIMYDRYNISAHQIVLSASDFIDGLIEGSRFLDNPVNDVAYAGMYKAFQAAAAQACVAVYEGEGSDEIFCTSHSRGEYDMQKFLIIPFALRQLLFGFFKRQFSEGATLWDKVSRMLARFAMSDFERRSTWIPAFSAKTRERLLGRSVRPLAELLHAADGYYQNTKLKDEINKYQYGLVRLFLADDLLFKNERMASSVGIVNRTPFLDYRLVETAFTIPAKYKMSIPKGDDDGTKLIFKKAVRGLVPDSILDRKKTRGFSQPTAVWYHNSLKDFVLDHLIDPNAKLYNWLERKEVHKICNDFMTGSIRNDYFLNSLLILELWLRNYGVMEGRYYSG